MRNWAEKVTEWRAARKTIAILQQNERDQTRRAEFLRFEIEEIEKAQLQTDEIEELEAGAQSIEQCRTLARTLHQRLWLY